MQKKILPFIVVITALTAALILLSDYFVREKPLPSRMSVATTIFPLFDITSNIAKGRMEVINIMPPEASPHTYELSPSDAKKLENVDLIFTIGNGLDDWAKNLAKSVGDKEVFEISANIELKSFETGSHDHRHESEHEYSPEHRHEDEESGKQNTHLDPHYWLSIINAKLIAQNIADKIIQKDPENAKFYQDNLLHYQKELNATHDIIDSLFHEMKGKNLIVFHDSWNYFADEFGFNIVGVFEPYAGKEPTPQYLAELMNTAKANNIKAVFSEPQLSTAVIKPFVNDLGLKLYVLDPLGGLEKNKSYIDTMLNNAETIYQALNE